MTDPTGNGGIVCRPAGQEELRVLLSASQSDDALGCVEMVFGPMSAGPPLHLHPTHGEGFYVLDGELTLQVGDDVLSGGPGTWAFAPRNVPHTLANHTDETVRLLCVFAPGGFERRFERMLAGSDPAALAALAERSPQETRTQLLGPPLPLP